MPRHPLDTLSIASNWDQYLDTLPRMIDSNTQDSASEARYTVKLPADVFVACGRTHYLRRLKATPPKRPIARLVQFGAGAAVAAIAFLYEPSVWLGWAATIYAGGSLLKLFITHWTFRILHAIVVPSAIVVLSFMWIYTWPLAIIVLVILTLTWGSFLLLPVAMRYSHRAMYGEPVEVGFDDVHFWIGSASKRRAAKWSDLTGWSRLDRWISLHSKPTGAVFLPLSGLQQDGQLNRVLKLAGLNAKESNA